MRQGDSSIEALDISRDDLLNKTVEEVYSKLSQEREKRVSIHTAFPGGYRSTFEHYERNKEYLRAACGFKRMGLNSLQEYEYEIKYFLRAAENFARAGDHLEAGKSFERARHHQEALHTFRKAKSVSHIRRVRQYLSRQEQAKVLLSLRDYRKAGEIFLGIKRYEDAAEAFSLGSLWEEAGDSYRLAEQYCQSALMYQKAGASLEAVEDAYLSDIYEHEKMAELLRLAGLTKYAEEILSADVIERIAALSRYRWRARLAVIRFHIKHKNFMAAIRMLNDWGGRKDKLIKAILLKVVRLIEDKEQRAGLLDRVSQYEEAASLYRDCGDYENAAWCFLSAEKPKNAADMLFKAAIFREAAEEYFKLGLFEKARRTYKKVNYRFAVGLLLKETGRPSAAKQHFSSLAQKLQADKRYQEAAWAFREAGHHQATTLEKKVLEILKSGAVTNAVPLGGGKTYSWLFSLGKDIQAVFKPDYDKKINDSDREIAASVVDRLFGFDFVPLTIKRTFGEFTGSLQYFVQNAKLGFETRIFREDVGDLAFFDFLIGFPDRHWNNYLILEGKIVAIDHGMAFSSKGQDEDTFPKGRPTNTFLTKLSRIHPYRIRQELKEYLSPDSLESLLARRLILLKKFHGPDRSYRHSSLPKMTTKGTSHLITSRN